MKTLAQHLAEPAPPIDDRRLVLARIEQRIEELRAWARQLRAELRQKPETVH